MPVHYGWRRDLSKYTLKSFTNTNEFAFDTNNSDVLTYDANGTTSVVVDTTRTQTLTNKTLTAAVIGGATTLTDATTFVNASDATKILALSLSGMTTGTTLTLSSLQSTAQTLTIPNITAGDTLVTLAQTQTLTNKTLTSPAIAGTPVINTLKGNFSTSTVSAGYSSDTYLAGSAIAIPTGGWIAGGRFYWCFDMVKTGAGTAAFTINVRMGTGVIGDTSLQSIAFGAGTTAADTGLFEVFGHFRTVGSGTAAVLVLNAYCSHHLAATGLISTGASGFGQVTNVSSGFDSTVSNGVIGLSINGGASFSGTNTIVEAEYHSF